jgi:hypothetical protein
MKVKNLFLCFSDFLHDRFFGRYLLAAAFFATAFLTGVAFLAATFFAGAAFFAATFFGATFLAGADFLTGVYTATAAATTSALNDFTGGSGGLMISSTRFRRSSIVFNCCLIAVNS